MQKYRDWAPTVFDQKGHVLSERQSWRVCPVIRTRDSRSLEESNFRSFLKRLGGETEDIEVHRFGHWGPGWVEIIIVRPGTDAHITAGLIQDALESYPVVDEDDYSELEFERISEYWESLGTEERIDSCQRAGDSIFAARHDSIPEGVYDRWGGEF